MSTITFSIFNSIQAKTPYDSIASSVEGFLEIWADMHHDALESKDKAEAFSVCTYRDPKAGRKRENIEGVTAITLDIDHLMNSDAIEALQEKLAGHPYILYSTYSSDVAQRRYKLRVSLPLAEHVSADDYEEQKIALRCAKWLGVKIDPVSQRAGQLYFLPTCAPGAEEGHILEVGKSGDPLDVADLPALKDGDHKRFLQGDSRRKAKVGEEDEAKRRQEIFKLLDGLINEHFAGVPPIFTEACFQRYEDGYWRPLQVRTLTRMLMTDIFKEQRALDTVLGVVDYMKVRYHQDVFPLAPSDEDGRVLNPLICLRNGTLDPLAGRMVPNAPENYLRTCMTYPYDPEATCERWLQFLDEVFAPDADKTEKILLLQEFMGYLLIPSTRFQAMLWLYGVGANGKSVVNEVVNMLLGTENTSSIPLDRLSKRFQSAELVGKLANVVDEVGADGALRDDILKQAVAGNMIQGERKGKDPFKYRPYARFVVAMNHFPRVKDTSHGFFRRIQLLTFNRKFAPEEQDRDLVPKLRLELPGIFCWALEGLQRLWTTGTFTAVPSSVAALAQYQEECNPVALFVRDLVVPASHLSVVGDSPNKAAKTLIHDVYRTYVAYCRAKGFAPLSDARFGREMSNLDYKAMKSSGKRYYALTLRNPETVGIYGMGQLDTDRSANAQWERDFDSQQAA